ncbi:MAG: hypothetical protein U9O89_01025 [Thermoproteota archaeon]|nr:hypothetical protein [Thermoproteota archaeon]
MGIVRNICQVLKKLKHGEPQPKFCPRCGSSKIRLSSRFDVWLTPEQYVCENCGYRGPIVMELEEKQKPSSLKRGE